MQIIKTRQPKFFALFLWSMNSILSLIIHRMPFQISRNGLTCAHFDQFQKYEIVEQSKQSERERDGERKGDTETTESE